MPRAGILKQRDDEPGPLREVLAIEYIPSDNIFLYDFYFSIIDTYQATRTSFSMTFILLLYIPSESIFLYDFYCCVLLLIYYLKKSF